VIDRARFAARRCGFESLGRLTARSAAADFDYQLLFGTPAALLIEAVTSH
jgi:hypothetical protein